VRPRLITQPPLRGVPTTLVAMLKLKRPGNRQHFQHGSQLPGTPRPYGTLPQNLHAHGGALGAPGHTPLPSVAMDGADPAPAGGLCRGPVVTAGSPNAPVCAALVVDAAGVRCTTELGPANQFHQL
jgi:hypothetical protein